MSVLMSGDAAGMRMAACVSPARLRDGAHLSGLSPRERETFFLIVEGKTIQEAARSMNIRRKTAENYRCRVLTKLCARNAVEAVHYAVRHGMLVAREHGTLMWSESVCERDRRLPFGGLVSGGPRSGHTLVQPGGFSE